MTKLYFHWKHKPSQTLLDQIKEKGLDMEQIEVSQMPSYPDFLKGVPTIVHEDYIYTGTSAMQLVEQMEGRPPTPESNSPVKEKINMQDCKSFLAERDAEIQASAKPVM